MRVATASYWLRLRACHIFSASSSHKKGAMEYRQNISLSGNVLDVAVNMEKQITRYGQHRQCPRNPDPCSGRGNGDDHTIRFIITLELDATTLQWSSVCRQVFSLNFERRARLAGGATYQRLRIRLPGLPEHEESTVLWVSSCTGLRIFVRSADCMLKTWRNQRKELRNRCSRRHSTQWICSPS